MLSRLIINSGFFSRPNMLSLAAQTGILTAMKIHAEKNQTQQQQSGNTLTAPTSGNTTLTTPKSR